MRGGSRQGSGRKQGFAARSAEEARKLFAERVAEEIDPICDVLIRRAKMGDIRAIKELLDRAWGRPSQAIQVESGRLPTPILHIDPSFMTDEELRNYIFTEEQKSILEERFAPKK